MDASGFKATDSNKLSRSDGGLFADKIDRQDTVHTGALYPGSLSVCRKETGCKALHT